MERLASHGVDVGFIEKLLQGMRTNQRTPGSQWTISTVRIRYRSLKRSKRLVSNTALHNLHPITLQFIVFIFSSYRRKRLKKR